MARVLLTGATGFIGARLLPQLLERHEVYALARRPPMGGPGAHWLQQDLSEALDQAQLPARIDAVIHLAQSRLYRSFPEGASDMFQVNVRSTFELLEYARHAGARSFVAASSGGIYASGATPLTEEAPIQPANFYLRSRRSAEVLVEGYSGLMTTVLLRFFFVYGPGQHGMLFPMLLNKVLAGEQIVVDGRPGMLISPTWIGDALRVFEPALALETSTVVNVAGDEALSIGELAELMGAVAGRPVVVRYTDQTAPAALVADNSRMKTRLGITPLVALRDGLRAMLAEL